MVRSLLLAGAVPAAVVGSNSFCELTEGLAVKDLAYTAVVSMELPYANIDIPMTFSVSKGKERIEYYQGLQSDYYVNGGKYKYAFQNSVRKCMKNEAPHAEEDMTYIHPFPTSCSDYKYVGTDMVNGVVCEKYEMYTPHGNTHSMDDHVEFWYDALLKKPVQWRMHSRNKIFSSHTDEYIVHYLSFLPGEPAEWELPSECASAEAVKAQQLSFPLEHFLWRSPRNAVPAVKSEFHLFAASHGLDYATPEEWKMRENLFYENVEKIKQMNIKHKGQATFKVNRFAAMTLDEVKKIRTGRKPSDPKSPRFNTNAVQNVESKPMSFPENFDWRSHAPGSVAPVKDQGICGSCWAFSLISAVESANFVKTSKMELLPEQYVIDCTWTNELAACDGGLSDKGAYEIIKKYDGIVPSAESYGQYLTVDGYCRGASFTNSKVGAKIVDFVDVQSRNDTAVMEALLKQPLSVAFNVGDEAIYYDSGILNTEACEVNDADHLNHAINLVGYGKDEKTGLEYWTLRNSWSTYWGDEGYFRVVRGKRDCGVSTDAGYPVLATSEDSADAATYESLNTIFM